MGICTSLHIEIIDVEDELFEEDYINYFSEVEKMVSVIEYRQLRRNWLDYQKCTTDVVGFCKKTKILLRGEKLVLRIFRVFISISLTGQFYGQVQEYWLKKTTGKYMILY